MQLKFSTGERIEQAIWLDFPAYNNETEYEAILARIDLVMSVSSENIIIQVNGEYETRNQCMLKYVCLVNLRLEIFSAWKLEHIPRDSNEKADALATVA